MMNKLIVTIPLLFLASCANNQSNPDLVVLNSCLTFSKSLKTLAAAKSQGMINDAQSKIIDQSIMVAAPICLSENPGIGNNASTLEAINSQLETLIFSTGGSNAN